MENPGLPSGLWEALDGRLWHATCPTGLAGIVQTGEIRVFHDRYKNSLCKMLGGVSLMDFGTSATNREAQFRNWSDWFGHAQECRVPIWIEIDRGAVQPNLLEAEAVRVMWAQKNFSRLIIPGVEACHKGPIPVSALSSILCVDRHDRTIFAKFSMTSALAEVCAFESRLPPPPPVSPIIAALRAGRERAEAKRRASSHSSEGTDQ